MIRRLRRGASTSHLRTTSVAASESRLSWTGRFRSIGWANGSKHSGDSDEYSSSRRKCVGRSFRLVLFLSMSWTIALSTFASDVDDVISPEQISLLLQRINSYNTHFKNRDYDSAYEMLSGWWTDSAKERREWVHSVRKMDNGIKITGWRVISVRVAENRAKVMMDMFGKTREGVFKWSDFTEKSTDYWVFERENWYFIPYQVEDWNDKEAVEVPLPKNAPNGDKKNAQP